MTIVMSDRGEAFLERREGFSATAYKDADGYSIGFGYFLKTAADRAKYLHATITKEEARLLMQGHLHKVESDLERLVKVPLEQHQADALISFCYNVGTGEDGFGGSTMLKLLNAGEYGLTTQFLRWKFSRKVFLPSLLERRKLEARLFSGDLKAYDE